jgi:hypothetical protein
MEPPPTDARFPCAAPRANPRSRSDVRRDADLASARTPRSSSVPRDATVVGTQTQDTDRSETYTDTLESPHPRPPRRRCTGGVSRPVASDAQSNCQARDRTPRMWSASRVLDCRLASPNDADVSPFRLLCSKSDKRSNLER